MSRDRALIESIKNRLDNVRVNASDHEKARALEDIEDMIDEHEDQ